MVRETLWGAISACFWQNHFFWRCGVKRKTYRIRRVKRCCETVADNLTNAGWRCGCISSTDHDGLQFWVVAAERENAGRFIVHADEMLTAFVELHTAIHRQFKLG
jgi:hypothetical protein